jgi:hypothetical protein
LADRWDNGFEQSALSSVISISSSIPSGFMASIVEILLTKGVVERLHYNLSSIVMDGTTTSVILKILVSYSRGGTRAS